MWGAHIKQSSCSAAAERTYPSVFFAASHPSSAASFTSISGTQRSAVTETLQTQQDRYGQMGQPQHNTTQCTEEEDGEGH